MGSSYQVVQIFPMKDGQVLRIKFPVGQRPQVGSIINIDSRELTITGITMDRTEEMIRNNEFDCWFKN